MDLRMLRQQALSRPSGMVPALPLRSATLVRFQKEGSVAEAPATADVKKGGASLRSKGASLIKVVETPGSSQLPIPSGPFTWPLVGETSDLLEKGMLRFGLERLVKYGPIFKTSFFGMDVVMVTSPEIFKAVMAEDTKLVNFDMGGAFAKIQGDFNMAMLENRNGARMPFRRSMLSAVTQEALAGYIPKMLSIAEAQVAYIASQPQFDINTESRKWGMAYANNLLAGISTAGEEDEKQLRDQLAVFFDGVMTYDIDLPGTPLRKALDARAILLARIQQSIRSQLSEILKETPSVEGAPKIRKNMLGYVIDGQRAEGTELSPDFLANMALSLLQAGTDTSAAGFAGLFAILAQRPDVWNKLREEQRSVIQAHGSAINKVTVDSSKYLDACVREGVRMHPVSTAQYRRTAKDMEVAGKLIPAGTMIVFNVPVMQATETEPGYRERAAAVTAAGGDLPMPEGSDIKCLGKDFDPERWLVSDPALRPSMMAFGHGPHTCLGIGLYVNEAKILLAHLIRKYDIELLTKEFTWLEMPVVKPGDGVQMRLVPLSQPLV